MTQDDFEMERYFALFMIRYRTLNYLSCEPLHVKKPQEFLTRSDKNRAVQPQKMARALKFQIWEVEGLHYLCSENKGADQLCDYHTADLRLFCIYKKQVSPLS